MNYLLAAWLCLPSFLMVVLSLPSLAIGLIFTSFAAMLSSLLLNLKRRVHLGKPYLVILTVAAISVFVSHFIGQQPLSQKQGLAMAGLLVLAFSASTLLHHYFSREAGCVSRGLKGAYFFLVVIGLIGVMWPVRVGPFTPLNHPVFPFAEPSHFTLAYAQVASLLLPFLKRRGRLAIVLISFFLAFGFPSATMLVVALLLSLVTIPLRWLFILAISVVPVIWFITASAPEAFVYFTDRLANTDEGNLSRLMYIQGWENLISAISTTSGAGVSFQNLGNEPAGVSTELIRALTGGVDLNRADGGFLFAKIGGEFGVLGVFVALTLIVMSIWSGVRVRRELKADLSAERALAILPLFPIYIFIVEILIRGVGYFSPTFLLTLYFIPQAMRLLLNKRSRRAALKTALAGTTD